MTVTLALTDTRFGRQHSHGFRSLSALLFRFRRAVPVPAAVPPQAEAEAGLEEAAIVDETGLTLQLLLAQAGALEEDEEGGRAAAVSCAVSAGVATGRQAPPLCLCAGARACTVC